MAVGSQGLVLMEQESYQCIQLLYGTGGNVTFLNLFEASNETNLRYELSLTYKQHPLNNKYYKVWIRFQLGGKYRAKDYVTSIDRALKDNIQWYTTKTSKNNHFTDAVIMLFGDSEFTQPISMQIDDIMIKLFSNRPGIKAWLMHHCDEFKPVDKNKDIRDDVQ